MSWYDHGYLTCKHCGVEFLGTRSQIKHVKYEGTPTFCSPLCRKAGSPLRKPKPNYGPCPTCGEMFTSRQPKIYCSMKCYVGSPTFREMARSNGIKGTARLVENYEEYVRLNTVPCTECGKPYYYPPAKHRRFCSKLCRRNYFSKRFDRWIANPQEIALPQNFDEFLTQTELPCLVKGCNWFGKQLSNHMNAAHGVPKKEFKRAAGFNLNSGIISADLAELFQGRERHGIALGLLARHDPPTIPRTRRYHSLEGREHRLQAQALLRAEPGPIRTCRQCGKEFQQTSVCGHVQYCSTHCRNQFYRAQGKKYPLTCSACGKSFNGELRQAKRAAMSEVVACSTHCRQSLNGRSVKVRKRAGSN